jgi:hypothetical protein
MFFARTQREHVWKSPQYRFTWRQREAWEALVREARRTVKAEAEDAEEADEEIGEEGNNEMETDEEIGEEGNNEMETDEEIDKEIDVNDIDQATEAAPDLSTASIRQKKLSRLQKACLEFCIALLDHQITRREYDSPFVCAMAVLCSGGEDGR